MAYLITAEAEVVVAAENFTNNTRELLEAAFDFGLTPVEFKIYFCLVRLADGDFRLSQSIEKLATICNIKSRNTVKRVLDSLVAMAIIRRFPIGKSFVYQLTNSLEWVKITVPSESDECSYQESERSETQEESKPPQSEQKIFQENSREVCDAEGGMLSCEGIFREESFPPKMPHHGAFYAQKLTYQFLTYQFLSIKQQDSSTPPPKGGCAESVVASDDLKPAQILTPSKNEHEDNAVAEESMNLAEKIDFFRRRGHKVGTPEQNGAKVVIVDGLFLSVEEFMQRSVEYFTQVWQPCAEGLAMCWARLEKAKQRLKHKAMPSAGTEQTIA